MLHRTYKIVLGGLLAMVLTVAGCSKLSNTTTTETTSETTSETTTSETASETTTSEWNTDVFEDSDFILGTIVTIKIMTNGSDELLDRCFERLVEIENAMSVNIADSDVSKVNEAARNTVDGYSEPVKVGEDTFNVIKTGIQYGDLSQGNFDISFGPVIDLWQIGTEDAHIPEAVDIDNALQLVDYQNIRLDEANMTVSIEKDMKLDLGGIAKGYAADAVDAILDEAGVTRAIINLGGNIKIVGEKEGGDAFKVGIQNPFNERNTYLGIASVKDKTVVTSGDYERYFEENGVRYHHIFDKATGWPKVTEVKSVSVITARSIDADALSTILFVSDIQDGIDLVNTLEGVECIYVTKDKKVYQSSGMAEAMFKLTDDSFQLVNN